MKYLSTIFCVIFTPLLIFAHRQLSFYGTFKGEKMWDSLQMQTVPYREVVSLELMDTIAHLKYSEENVDTFVYCAIYNNGYRYIREKYCGSWEFLWISNDAMNLQVGEPKEQICFYKLRSDYIFTICHECHGKGNELCHICQGIGRVKPRRNGSPEEAVGICAYCHGTGSITYSPCRRCNGSGQIKELVAN